MWFGRGHKLRTHNDEIVYSKEKTIVGKKKRLGEVGRQSKGWYAWN